MMNIVAATIAALAASRPAHRRRVAVRAVERSLNRIDDAAREGRWRAVELRLAERRAALRHAHRLGLGREAIDAELTKRGRVRSWWLPRWVELDGGRRAKVERAHERIAQLSARSGRLGAGFDLI